MLQKFYFPLTVNSFERDDWGVDWDNPTEADGRTAYRYRGEIENKFDEYNDGFEEMAEYFHSYNHASAASKILSAVWRFEAVDGCLFGRVDFILTEAFTSEETETVKDWICGQNSDGLGEGFEQREIRTKDDRIINVSFWNRSDDYRIMTEEEFKAARA